MTNSELLLGIDPGSSKTGAALVRLSGEIVKTQVILMQNFAAELKAFSANQQLSCCVLGNGTTSRPMAQSLHTLFPQLAIQSINEAHSREEARNLYWRLYPPKGWRRFMPVGLLVPPENLDGLAAAVLVGRYLKCELFVK